MCKYKGLVIQMSEISAKSRYSVFYFGGRGRASNFALEVEAQLLGWGG